MKHNETAVLKDGREVLIRNGDATDPLVWSILEKSVVSINYTPISEEEYTNRVVMEQNIE